MLRTTWKDVRKKLTSQVHIGEIGKFFSSLSVSAAETDLAALKEEKHAEWRKNNQWRINAAYQKIERFNSLYGSYNASMRQFKEMNEPLTPKYEEHTYKKWAKAHGELPKA
jgi:hypothetical protein